MEFHRATTAVNRDSCPKTVSPDFTDYNNWLEVSSIRTVYPKCLAKEKENYIHCGCQNETRADNKKVWSCNIHKRSTIKEFPLEEVSEYTLRTIHIFLFLKFLLFFFFFPNVPYEVLEKLYFLRKYKIWQLKTFISQKNIMLFKKRIFSFTYTNTKHLFY